MKLSTPRAVQSFLRTLPYNRKDTLRSAAATFKAGEAHCLEAAWLAAALLEPYGYPPWVVSFESQDGLDHVVYVFRERGLWGAVARSRDEGLHGRAPVFRSIRDLAWSYFDPYVDKTGCLTAYQLLHLDDTESDWRASSRNVWKAERYMLDLKHQPMRFSRSRYFKLKENYLRHGPMKPLKFWW